MWHPSCFVFIHLLLFLRQSNTQTDTFPIMLSVSVCQTHTEAEMLVFKLIHCDTGWGGSTPRNSHLVFPLKSLQIRLLSEKTQKALKPGRVVNKLQRTRPPVKCYYLCEQSALRIRSSGLQSWTVFNWLITWTSRDQGVFSRPMLHHESDETLNDSFVADYHENKYVVCTVRLTQYVYVQHVAWVNLEELLWLCLAVNYL